MEEHLGGFEEGMGGEGDGTVGWACWIACGDGGMCVGVRIAVGADARGVEY